MAVKIVSDSCKDVVLKVTNNSEIVVQLSRPFEVSVIYIKLKKEVTVQIRQDGAGTLVGSTVSFKNTNVT